MGMTAAVLSGFVLALAAPGLHRRTGRATGWVAASEGSPRVGRVTSNDGSTIGRP